MSEREPNNIEPEWRLEPEFANSENGQELEWIEQHRDVFWLISKVASDQVGKGALVIDTTTQTPEGGHPIRYLAQSEQQDETAQHLQQEYDPNTEFIVTLLKSEGRTSTYKGTVPPIGWSIATKTTLTEQEPNKEPYIPEALFDLGQIVITRGAAEETQNIGRHPIQLIARHIEGEWGELPPEDIEENDYALQRGTRIFSAYNIEGAKFYVITEWDRSVTTLLLPNEY